MDRMGMKIDKLGFLIYINFNWKCHQFDEWLFRKAKDGIRCGVISKTERFVKTKLKKALPGLPAGNALD